MVTARDVLDNRKRVIIYARARGDCQTITEENPSLLLTGPTRAILTCQDPGNIEIVLKVKGETESLDRDLSSLVLTLSEYCSFRGDYITKRSTLELGFHHNPCANRWWIGVATRWSSRRIHRSYR